MKSQKRTLIKSLLMAMTFAGVLILAEGLARADEVTITGFTSGTVTGIPQLTFAGSEFFTGTTSMAVGALNGPNSLGTFFLDTAPGQFVTGTFSLNVTFTSPTGIAGGQTIFYSATFFGSLSPNVNQGGVSISFNSLPQVYTFADGTNFGSFSLTLPNVFVQSGHAASLTGFIVGRQSQTIPEPATLLLVGTGLTGIAVKLRKRRKESQKA